MTSTTHSPPSLDLATWWQRIVPWWHVAFAADLAVTATAVLIDGTSPVVLVPLALLAVAYVAAGVPALRRDSLASAVAYLVVAAGVLAVTTFLSPAGMFLLIALYPQCFAMFGHFRRAAVGAVVLALAGSLALAARDDWTGEAVAGATITGAVNLTIALAIGLFVSSIIREAARRAELISTLTETQQQLATAHHLAGVLAERERLAREIHDTLAQGFTNIVVLSRAIETELGEQAAPGVRDKLAVLRETATSNLAEARALVTAMTPADLADSGLVDAVQRAVDRCAREASVAATFDVEGTSAPLSGSTEVVLLRVVQEAIANVVKHAHATRVQLVLTYGEACTELVVTDDGVGFAATTPTGYGLAGMRQRVQEAGGTLDVESAPGRGTRVRVAL